MRRKTISKDIDHQWQTDLIVIPALAKENKNHKYILTCIDVLSRYAFAVPIKTKSGADVAAGLRLIFKKHKRIPKKLQSDNGREYYNANVKKLCKQHDIIHFSSMSQTKCALVERFQRTLMTKLYRYFTAKNTLKYIDVLEALIKSYNNKYHRTLGMAPVEVTKKNVKAVFQHLYGSVLNKKVQRFRFQIGDLVRISKHKRLFTKGYLRNFTDEYFKVIDRVPSYPVTYRLSDLKDNVIGGIFYQAELQRVRILDPENKAYKIEILKTRNRGKNTQYLVHYVGWPKEFDEWVATGQLVK